MASDLPWAVVTGASGGLGEALARDLAQRGYNLVLVSRGQAAMDRIATELRARCPVQIVVEPVDLSAAGSAALLCARLEQGGIAPAMLINNAAFGISEDFIRHDAERLRAMLQLDIVTLTELTLLLGRQMARAGRGHIMLIASVAAFQPTPSLAAYSAGKAYVLSLGEALNVELAGKVVVTVLSPGLMDTGFNAASGFETPTMLRRTILTPAEVAAIGLDAMFSGKSGVVAGRWNQIATFIGRFFSRHFLATSARRMAGK